MAGPLLNDGGEPAAFPPAGYQSDLCGTLLLYHDLSRPRPRNRYQRWWPPAVIVGDRDESGS